MPIELDEVSKDSVDLDSSAMIRSNVFVLVFLEIKTKSRTNEVGERESYESSCQINRNPSQGSPDQCLQSAKESMVGKSYDD